MSFTKQLEQFATMADKRVEATLKDATLRVVRDAQRTRDFGGRMRVKTGFLRASIQAAIGQMPDGPSINPQPNQANAFRKQLDGLPVEAAVLAWDLRLPLFIGWTANYARIREYRDGFMRGAAERWPEFVRRATNKAKAEIR